jgi:hypothetical protein
MLCKLRRCPISDVLYQNNPAGCFEAGPFIAGRLITRTFRHRTFCRGETPYLGGGLDLVVMGPEEKHVQEGSSPNAEIR